MARTGWFRKLLVLAALLAVGTGSAWAGGKATPDEAKALVKKAAAFVKANGNDKAIAEFNNRKGQFVNDERELYIFVLDKNGTTLANGVNQRLVGKNVMELKDVDGKKFIKEMITTAEAKGSGWVDYKWTNQTTNAIEPKSTYFEKVNDIVVGCGVYK
jgi:signal transduction histidine kinase